MATYKVCADITEKTLGDRITEEKSFDAITSQERIKSALRKIKASQERLLKGEIKKPERIDPSDKVVAKKGKERRTHNTLLGNQIMEEEIREQVVLAESFGKGL